MTRTEYALAYSKCSDHELQQFIRDRGLTIQWTSRRAVIRALRIADTESTFTFLRLPAELRNLVYEKLLRPREKGVTSHRKYCWPQITSTSKQVHKETEGLLYAPENEFYICFKLTNRNGFFDGYYYPRIYFNHQAIALPAEWTLQDQPVPWPVSLSKMRRIHLCFEIEQWRYNDEDNATRKMNHILYDLHHFLAGHGKLQAIRVDLRCNTFRSKEDLSRILAPLRLMHCEKDVNPSDQSPAFNAFMRETVGDRLEGNLLQRCREIRAKICQRIEYITCNQSNNAEPLNLYETCLDLTTVAIPGRDFAGSEDDDILRKAIMKLESKLGGLV